MKQLIKLSEAEEATQGYSVKKLAEKEYPDHKSHHSDGAGYVGFIKGFKSAMELTKDKKFTVEDMIQAIQLAREKEKYNFDAKSPEYKFSYKQIINQLLPKTQCPVEIDEQGKIKLI